MSHDAFANASQKLLFGDSEVAKQNQILNIHTITGTGALRLGFEFLHSVSPNTTVYIPESSWMNYS
jgi:aspartate/tyrosine/aromatic aminotransferase